MSTDLLRIAQWLSPAFPLSGYAYSHGLEAAMAEGRVRDGDSLSIWAACVLERGSGALDAWVIARVMEGADPDEMADLVAARAGSAERWEEVRAMGAAFCATTTALGEPPLTDLPLPVALGLRARGMAVGMVLPLYLQAFGGQLVSAAARFLPLGQDAAQGILAGLHPVIARVATSVPDAAPGTGALMAEIDALAHETLQPRMFRT